MRSSQFQFYSFIFLILAVFVLTFFVFAPYLTAIFLAILLVIAFEPAHRVVERMIPWRNISSLVSTILVLVIILIPFALFGTLLFQEVQGISEQVVVDGGVGVAQYVENVEVFIEERVPGVSVDLQQYLDIEEFAKDGVGNVAGYFNTLFSGALRVGIGLFLMILAMFYLFRDGREFARSVIKTSPLNETHTTLIMGKMKEAVNAVVRGRLLVGLIQGVVIGVGLAVFGIPNSILWGAVAAVSSMLPVVGPMFVVIPAAIFLFLTQAVFAAVGLLIWGVASAIIVDEYLGSILVDQRMKIHPFLVLVSVIGGIYFFGVIGFVAGPVVLALLFALLSIYPQIVYSLDESGEKS